MKSIVAAFIASVLVTTTSCHLICSTDEIYLDRGPAYEPTCAEFNPISRVTNDLTFSGCFCASGRVREETTGLCVNRARCRCGVNQYRDYRGNCVSKSMLGGGSLVGDLFGQRQINFYETGVTRCPMGFKRHVSGRCVLISCPPGTVRDASGRCVVSIPLDYAIRVPKQRCMLGEIYQECGPVYQPTCAEPRIRTSRIETGCLSGCFCKSGYLRKELNGRCVAASDCY